jgi:hypothetical protein
MESTTGACRRHSCTQYIRLGALLFLLLAGGCGRPAAAPTQQQPFSMVLLPDTQYYSQRWPDLFFAQTNWIKKNRDKENIVFVMHLGDLVQNRSFRPSEWKVADKAMAVLDGVVPYGVAIGNHDYDSQEALHSGLQEGIATMYLQHFDPEKRFKDQPGYGGASSNRLNSYHLLSAGGIDLLILFLEHHPSDEALEWARGVLAQFPDRWVIVALHSYLLGLDGIGRDHRRREVGNSGEMVWDKFIRSQPRVFMVVCGHVGRADEYHQISYNDAGGQVLEMLVCYQRRRRGGDGWLRIIRFVPSRREMQMRTFSPVLDQFETDANSEFVVPWEPEEWRSVVSSVQQEAGE